MTNVLGPQSPNYTTTRPATDAAVSGGVQTWFVDCSAPGAQDGTVVSASWFNSIVGNLQYLSTQSGEVPTAEGDDTFLYRAVAAVAAGAAATAISYLTP